MDANRVVVGLDGSPGSAAALRWALELGRDGGVPVDAVSAWHVPVAIGSPWAPVPDLGDPEEMRAAHERHLQQVVDEVRATVPDAPAVDVRVVAGFAGPTLVDQSADAALLVVGRRGRGGFLGLLLGSVADHCARSSAVPVALVPPDGPPTTGPVVAGIDGSEHAVVALRWAAGLATRLGRTLVALRAWTWLDQPGEFDPAFDADEARALAAAQVAEVLGDAGGDVAVEVVNALPTQALLDRSAAGDLVVVGSRGLGGVRATLLGSVSGQLAHHAPGAVVIVPSTSP